MSELQRPDHANESERAAKPPPPEHTTAEAHTDPHADILALQRMAGNRATGELLAGAKVEDVKGQDGQPLDPATREEMEARFGQSFGDVRVHTDKSAQTSAQAIGARAYTTGHDIVMGPGEPKPDTTEGKKLLAHELTHVVQQSQGNQGAARTISNPTDAAEGEAAQVAQTVARGSHAPAITSAGGGVQRDVGWAKRGPIPDPYGTKLLLNSFAAKFPEAAKLIDKNPSAMKLINEAEAAGIQFGGFSEDGPGKTLGRPYTSGTSVYVPKTSTDPVIAMNGFLFELNNALRAPKFAALDTEATKGSKGTLSAKDYAYKNVELEVEGMLRLGEIWFETKKAAKDPKLDKYDADFYYAEYKAFKDGKKTKDDIIKDVLKRVYDTGTLKGKTVEQYYIDSYNSQSGGK